MGSEAWGLEASIKTIRDGLRSAPRKRAVAYLVVTEHGSLVLVISATGVRALWPNLSLPELVKLFNSYDDGCSLQDCFLDKHPQFDRVLSKALVKVGKDLIAPVAEYIQSENIRDLALVPVGRLGLLPLHFAPCSQDRSTETLYDLCTVTYLPNASIGVGRNKNGVRQVHPLSAFVALANPRPSTRDPLPGAEQEVLAIGRLLPNGGSTVLTGETATRDAFFRLHADASVFHFAGHGIFESESPVKSHLVFANDETLTIADLLHSSVTPRSDSLAILSGCQTALVNFEDLPDESIGLPAALLVAGFPEVIGSLWRVSDVATSLIMVRFYECMAAADPGFDEPTQALRTAIRWFRDSNGSELNAFIQKHQLGFRHFPEHLSVKDQPSLWAGFIHVGS